MSAYRQYRAPRDDGAKLIDPDWSELLAAIAEAPRRRARAEIAFAGAPLAELAEAARRELLRSAREHTGRYLETVPADDRPDGRIVLTGHQPALYHPGVWQKNFAADALAKAVGAVGVNLLIDTDLCREASVATPTGSAASPRVEAIPFDALAEATPFEERRLRDPRRFASFPDRVSDAVRPFVDAPLACRLWPFAEAALGGTDRLGEALSAARHSIERARGGQTLEAPFSRVCDTAPFRRFAWELLRRAAAFRGAYNAALADYRVAHRVRSAAQPLPDLAERGGWIETPFWCWSESDATRRPLFARPSAERIELTDGAAWRDTLPADADGAVERFDALRSAGVKVRSRALVTTLYCRWLLADLFLHGIGGAKYDQVTDRLSERFFGAAPPPHATITATLRLPIEHDRVSQDDRRRALAELRALRFHPETFVAGADPAARPWVEQKRAAVATAKTPENAARRHALIVEANAALADVLADRHSAAAARLNAIDRRLRATKLLDSREYAFCLFPDDVTERLAITLPRLDAGSAGD